MSEISNMILDLCASIWYKSGTFEELYERKIESLKHVSEYSFGLIVRSAENKKYIYCRNDVYYCYKSTVTKVLNPVGYDVELK